MADLPRMRIRRGRVMHKVRRLGGGMPGYLRSECYRVNRTVKRGAQMPESYWTADRYWYPDCQHCPDTATNTPKES